MVVVPQGAVALAAVTGAHGIGGEVRLKLFTEDLSAYGSFNAGSLTLVSFRANIAGFAEVRDRSAAEALRGTLLTVPRSELPPLPDGEYYHADLIGLSVVTREGQVAGRVVAVENFGAGDVVEVERLDGRLAMLPMIPDAVPEWNADRMVVEAAFLE